jgi:hypothetical protein
MHSVWEKAILTSIGTTILTVLALYHRQVMAHNRHGLAEKVSCTFASAIHRMPIIILYSLNYIDVPLSDNSRRLVDKPECLGLCRSL